MLGDYFEWFKVGHIFFVITWMSGMLYLPRLFVYHTEVTPGSEEDKRFQTMERKLLRIIINPSMVLAILFGLLLAYIYGFSSLGMWFNLKMLLVCVMVIIHIMLSRWRKGFVNGSNKKSAKFYKIINEIPAIIMFLIIMLVIIKPFEE